MSYAIPRDTWSNDERNTTAPAEHFRAKPEVWWSKLVQRDRCHRSDPTAVPPLIKSPLPTTE